MTLDMDNPQYHKQQTGIRVKYRPDMPTLMIDTLSCNMQLDARVE